MVDLEMDVRAVLKDVSANSYSKAPVGLDDNLYELGILDSLTTVQFIIGIEKKLGIEVPNRDISYETFSTIREISKLLTQKVERRSEGQG
ncbi:MAG: hypothetical protein JNJ49_11890 [Bdellovibrionaceae bacterium]|nr:hypothetical protein [Pseudobdellovibrionaceae bacterium]